MTAWATRAGITYTYIQFFLLPLCFLFIKYISGCWIVAAFKDQLLFVGTLHGALSKSWNIDTWMIYGRRRHIAMSFEVFFVKSSQLSIFRHNGPAKFVKSIPAWYKFKSFLQITSLKSNVFLFKCQKGQEKMKELKKQKNFGVFSSEV